MTTNEYDHILVRTLGNKHIKDGTVYYDHAYTNALMKRLEKENLIDTYSKELKHNSQGVKMCSIASSSRFCYLTSHTILTDMDELEKTDVRNGCCHPNFDGYDSKSGTFYEFKCHEFCSTSHDKLTSLNYLPLLKDIFGIDCHNPKELRFSDFGLVIKDDPLINAINFDFKQFLCHIIGLLSVAEKRNPPKLNYVWVVPREPDNEELNRFVDYIKGQIEDVFKQAGAMDVFVRGEKGKLREFVTFALGIVPANDIHDFVLEEVD